MAPQCETPFINKSRHLDAVFARFQPLTTLTRAKGPRYSKKMWQERIQRYILPGSIEQDADFQQEVRRLSHIGLRVVGAVEIGVALFMTSIQMLLDPSREMLPTRAIMLAAVVGTGGLTALSARMPALYPHARLIASVSALLVAAILAAGLLFLTQFDPTADQSIPVDITLIMLVGVAAIPFRPTDMLVFGFLIECVYVFVALLMQTVFTIGRGVDPIYVLFIFMLTCVAAALTAVVYEQRRSTYEWHRRTTGNRRETSACGGA